MIDSRDLELLISVVETGSMRAASERSHLSQPAISRRIQTLESRLNVRLFQRTGRRLQLTEAGGEFLRRARDIVDRTAGLEVEMAAFGRGQRGVLRIGATVTVCLYLLVPALEKMRRQYPQYELYVANETSRRMPDLVREGAVDVGIASTGGELAGLHIRPWRSLHLGLLRAEAQNPEPVSIHELDGAPLVISSSGSLRSAVEAALRTHDVKPRVVAQADSLEVIRVLVGCGFGNAVVPLEVMENPRSGLSLTPFIEPVDPLSVACFYRRAVPPLKAFLEILEAR